MNSLQTKRLNEKVYALQCQKYTNKKSIRQLKKIKKAFLRLADGVLGDNLYNDITKAIDTLKKANNGIKTEIKILKGTNKKGKK